MFGIRFGCPQVTFRRLKETVTLHQVYLAVKCVSVWCIRRLPVARRTSRRPDLPFNFSSAKGVRCIAQEAVAFQVKRCEPRSADETAAPSHESLEREAARQTRSL